MNYIERNLILCNEDFTAKVRIALCDWINYWAINGTAEIADAELRQKTDMFINGALSNIESYVRRIAILVISEAVVKDAVEVTDANVQQAVTSIMSNALDYLI